jgi:hypothetical protein
MRLWTNDSKSIAQEVGNKLICRYCSYADPSRKSMRKSFFFRLALGVAAFVAGCDRGTARKLDHKNFNIDYKNFQGGIYGGREGIGRVHWIQIENKSNHDLDDVNVNVMFFHDDKTKWIVKGHWDHWKNGEVKKVMAGKNTEGLGDYPICRAVGEGTSKDFTLRFIVEIKQEF